MEATIPGSGLDHYPIHCRCDICGHEHACYVGGEPRQRGAAPVDWERHVCLGCLMRALTPDGFASCDDCRVQRTAPAGGRDA